MVHFVCPATEYGFEAMFALPHAYWLYKRGELESTSSVTGTAPLYFFSKSHEERDERRRYHKLREFDNATFDIVALNTTRWAPPPLLQHYKQLHLPLQFRKPLLMLGNKLCDEWEKGSVHYLPPEVVRKAVEILAPKYSVVYVRPGQSSCRGYNHDENTVFAGEADKEVVRALASHDAHVFEDLLDLLPGMPYNTLQLLLCARADDIACVQGGFTVLACYFARRLLVYAVEGAELRSGAYHTWFPSISGTAVTVAQSHSQFLQECAHLAQ